MKHLLTLLTTLLSSCAAAHKDTGGRLKNTSICDYYAAAALGQSNSSTQYTLLTLLVNTALVGNYSNSSTSHVPGILASNATINGTSVNLLPYFDGTLASSNRGGKVGKSINFLDDGGAAPLKENKPSNSPNSNQYRLLMHLYSYFGTLLGCSDMGQTSFPGYGGETSMYQVHKFMALNDAEISYFIAQIQLSAKSFNLQEDDIEDVGKALQRYFGRRCVPPATVLPDKGKELQAICIAHDCPKSPQATCKAYDKAVEPKNATQATSGSNSTSSSSSTATATNGGAQVGLSMGFVSASMLAASFVVFYG